MLGIWNLEVEPLSLGGVLMFAEELLAVSTMRQCRLDGVCVIGGDTPDGHDSRASGAGISRLERYERHLPPALAVLFDLDPIEAVYWAPADAHAHVLPLASDGTVWPSPDLLDNPNREFSYGTTLRLQAIHRALGSLPRLSFRPAVTRRASEILSDGGASVPIAVHLKNTGATGESNADHGVWSEFLRSCLGSYDARFLLIGNDPLPDDIRRLPNVCVTHDLGCTLSEELALIGAAAAFMGMASGPCNAALFSDVPYVIFKHPNHHAAEMAREMGSANQFPFAAPGQVLIRAQQTPDLLRMHFDALYAAARARTAHV